ncbi:MAG: LysM peptidoglycan-binding domain-containing protein [Flavobacteriales bacterium]|nr:LysM peptidoglycan-binding domain-containing protein [Flavobacteriales bacterium]
MSAKDAHQIKLRNRIKSIIALKDDTPLSVSNSLGMNLWQVYKYNDMKKGADFISGQIIYLQPKKNRGSVDYHVVRKGDNMYNISQFYGVKLERLIKLNSSDKIGKRGEKRIYLRKALFENIIITESEK